MNSRRIPSTRHSVLEVLDPKLAARIQDYRLRLSVLNCGYPVLTDWHPSIPEGWGEFPSVAMERTKIYEGNADSWAYSHHQTISKFNDKFVASWSNGFRHEDYVGQEVHCAWSRDGEFWSKPQVVAHTPVESKLVRNNAGLCAVSGKLYCYVCTANDFGRDVAQPGMCSLVEQAIRLDVYVTTDLEHWDAHENICDNVYLFEGPRRTLDGRYMCCGSNMDDGHAMVLIWDDEDELGGPPRVVNVQSPDNLKAEQGTWYQTDDGRIWMYQRDPTISCRLGLTFSDDGGNTWSDLLRTDFPNSYSRAFAGRLPDGRCYIVGNNYDILLDRRHLLMALSDDGYVFDRQYVLVEGGVTRRINGRHKEDGFHYPNCFADGGNLYVIYSVNKEDIEIGIVDIGKVD